VRRRVALAELEGASEDGLVRVLALLSGLYVLTMSATTVEVAHEALFSRAATAARAARGGVV
jgi:hypothetical protein